MTRERALELAREKLSTLTDANDYYRSPSAYIVDVILAACAEDSKEADAIIKMQAMVILQLRCEAATASPASADPSREGGS